MDSVTVKEGRELQMCTACGAEVRSGSLFCYSCGAKVIGPREEQLRLNSAADPTRARRRRSSRTPRHSVKNVSREFQWDPAEADAQGIMWTAIAFGTIALLLVLAAAYLR